MNNNVKIINSINTKGIARDINTIIKKYDLQGEGPGGLCLQISLQSYKPDADPREEWQRSNNGSYTGLNLSRSQEEFIYPLFPEAKLLNHYINKFGMYRTRVMSLMPSKVMSIHRDPTPRIHIPIFTNDGCRMIIEDQCYHLKSGLAYWTDTTLEHTAFNGGKQRRTHIVGCVKS